jgi:hypothetical protein
MMKDEEGGERCAFHERRAAACTCRNYSMLIALNRCGSFQCHAIHCATRLRVSCPPAAAGTSAPVGPHGRSRPRPPEPRPRPGLEQPPPCAPLQNCASNSRPQSRLEQTFNYFRTCGVFVQLHLALFPAGGPFLPSLSVKLFQNVFLFQNTNLPLSLPNACSMRHRAFIRRRLYLVPTRSWRVEDFEHGLS